MRGGYPVCLSLCLSLILLVLVLLPPVRLSSTKLDQIRLIIYIPFRWVATFNCRSFKLLLTTEDQLWTFNRVK